MKDYKTVKDVFSGIDAFHTVSHEARIKHAIEITKEIFQETDRCYIPIAILVLDDESHLVGTLAVKDILRGLEPKFMQAPAGFEGYQASEEYLSPVWASLFAEIEKGLAEKPIKDIMRPVDRYVGLDDPITKAAYIMHEQNRLLLPVVDGNESVVGVISIRDVFEEITRVVLDTWR